MIPLLTSFKISQAYFSKSKKEKIRALISGLIDLIYDSNNLTIFYCNQPPSIYPIAAKCNDKIVLTDFETDLIKGVGVRAKPTW